MNRNPIPDHVLDEARRLRQAGVTWNQLGEALGYHRDALRRRLDPDFHARIRERDRIREAELRKAYLWYRPAEETNRAMSADEWRAWRSRPVAPDTRSLTARLMGDPEPRRVSP